MVNIFVLGKCAAVAVGVVNRRNRAPNLVHVLWAKTCADLLP